MSVSSRTTLYTVIAGVTLTSVINRTEEETSLPSLELAAGLPGVLATRTDADTGIITLASGHGITTSDVIAVFFTGGIKQNCTVSATTSTTVSFTSTDGTDLPVVTSAVVIDIQEEFALLLDGDSLTKLVINSPQRSFVDFQSSAPASLLAYDIAAAEGRFWASGTNVTNPLASDTVATVTVANGGTVAQTIQIGMLKAA